MEMKEYRTVDKSAWPCGPWDDECDKAQWPDAATGLPCLIVRGPSGSLCGYVGVAEGHPLFGNGDSEDGLHVHGGITFSDYCADTQDESRHICHVAGPDEPQRVYWLGFDCAHSGDSSPKYDALNSYGTYRDVDYVRAECANLARQLKAIGD